MFNYRVLAIFKREIREKVMSKKFITTTVLVPLFMLGFIGLQALLMSYKGDNNVAIEIVSNSNMLTQSLKKEFSNLPLVKQGKYKISYKTVKKEQFQKYLKIKKEAILNKKLNGLLFIPENALKNKSIMYYSKTPNNFTVSERLKTPINKVLLENYFKGKNISGKDLSYARSNVKIQGFKVSKTDRIKEAGYGNIALSYLFTFLLYFSLLMIGQMLMQSVIEEKNNRIVEVLLSSVNSKELMAGKIFGSAVTGLLQMAVWLSPIILLMSTTLFVLPAKFSFDISAGQIIFLLFNFFIGLITFLGLFASVGSIFESAQEAQSGLMPIMILIIVPFFIALTLMQNPTNEIAKIASMFPFASIIVMPAKMMLVDVPSWQFIVAIVVNILTAIAIFPIAGKIYRVGILRTGKKPKWSEVIKWLKYNY